METITICESCSNIYLEESGIIYGDTFLALKLNECRFQIIWLYKNWIRGLVL